jgi:hypothetical protein
MLLIVDVGKATMAIKEWDTNSEGKLVFQALVDSRTLSFHGTFVGLRLQISESCPDQPDTYLQISMNPDQARSLAENLQLAADHILSQRSQKDVN